MADMYLLSPRDEERFGQERLTRRGHHACHWGVFRITRSKNDRV